MKMSEENDFQSNRSFTLFYYPSLRLPPRAMSQDKLYRFWCLLDGEGAFSAEAGLEWEVEQLAKAILQERGDLRKLDTSNIVLLKVRSSCLPALDCTHDLSSQLNEPIPVDPEETLLQRIPKLITNHSVKLRRTEQVSDAFPIRCKKHIQIIVMLRGKRLDYLFE